MSAWHEGGSRRTRQPSLHALFQHREEAALRQDEIRLHEGHSGIGPQADEQQQGVFLPGRTHG
jgi:hypothetical protein